MDKVNKHKAAFIICVNDMQAYEECLFYLERLKLPDGFEKDVITIQDAPSMAAGYNAGMKSSDAKYKIYMHQDVCILNQNFIEDMLRIFDSAADVGILGCVGTTHLGREAMAVTSWNTGKIIHNNVPMYLAFDEMEENFSKVDALDGLLLATQYDILWREDIMDGWDFYDVSQCMEYRRAGYQAAVPRQKTPWCYHDNRSTKMAKYNFYRKIFIEEYAVDGPFEMPLEWDGTLEYQKIKQQAAELMDTLIKNGEHEQLHEIFCDNANRHHMHLREYKVIADIDYLENRSGKGRRLWQPGLDTKELLQRVRQLKYWIKRIEHQAADTMQMMEQVMAGYSVYAVAEIFVQYVVDKEHTFLEIKRYFEQKHLLQEMEVWNLLMAGN